MNVRELRNHGSEVLDRVPPRRDADRHPRRDPGRRAQAITRKATSASALLTRWRRLPQVDPDQLRRDLDAVMDASL